MAQQLKLKDGRIIEYLVSGAEDGFPFIWIHGTPGAYILDPSLGDVCVKKNIKIITISRAGYGGSSRDKGRRVVDAVADIQAITDHLGVKRCIVGGWSGGGPHALACAARLPGCVAALSVAGVAPYDAEGLDFLAGQGEDNIEEYNAALKSEPELQKFCQAQRPDLLNLDVAGIVGALESLFPPVDQAAMKDSDLGEYLIAVFQEALKNSCDGWVDDDLSFVQPWGFELSEIKVPVLLYQGTEDKMVPFAHGEWLASHLPKEGLGANLLEGQGHVSIFLGKRDEMLEKLLAFAKA